ncbi:right-handed parallel beta-helix repeat-containing protein [Candidatus Eisenbacteria bacterium]|uniref:Right-handed parallel beta-helix repeat-containing protein n=1 Tax=Eiseniibacteriota bacterium TaxID=2212470 RepID=A0ABV6YJD2_UNCEI
MLRTLTILFVLLAGPLAPQATTYFVKPDGTGDVESIWAAIYFAEDGDVIQLADGTFTGHNFRDLEFEGKAITIESQSGNPEACIIDCQGTAEDPHWAFKLHAGEGSGSVLSGLTITGAYVSEGEGAFYSGAAIQCNESSPTISHCIFDGNVNADGDGRGSAIASSLGSPMISDCHFLSNESNNGATVEVYRGSPTIRLCTFAGNTALYGGAIQANEADISIEDCIFDGNTADETAGALHLAGASTPTIRRCVFRAGSATAGGAIGIGASSTATIEESIVSGCSAAYGGAVSVFDGGELTIIGCTFFGNESGNEGIVDIVGASSIVIDESIIAGSPQGPAVECGGFGTATVTCSNLYGNTDGDYTGCIADQLGTNGNISLDPLFCDSEGEDFRLQAGSPCLAGSEPNPECEQIGARGAGCSAQPTSACCIDEACTMLTEEVCLSEYTGTWFEGEDCATFQCPVVTVCCISTECYMVTESECFAFGGSWVSDPLFDTCAPNPCPVAVESASWGSIKARFR